MYSRHHRKVALLLALSDVVLTAAAFEAAYYTRLFLHLQNTFEITGPIRALLLGFSMLVWVTAARWLGAYERVETGEVRAIPGDAARQVALGVVAVVLLDFALKLDLSRPFLGLFAVYGWILLSIFRLHAGKWIGLARREFGAAHYVIVAGLSERALHLARELEKSSPQGVRLIGFLAEPNTAAPNEVRLEQSYPVHPAAELASVLRRQVVDEILFAVDGAGLASLEEVFLLCDEEGVRTRVAVDFFPHVNSDLYLDRLRGVPLLTFSAAPHDDVRLFAKRCVDVVVAAAALALLAPVMLGIALLIRITSHGPAIFRQVRCGINGRRFVFYKFRSMCDRAEEMKASLEHLNQKRTAFKIPNDPRLTPIGRYLRKFSIDEWPQFWNVLRGDMSLVGPRPAVPDEVENYERWQRRRLRMRPGLTCLWALNGRDALDFNTCMKLDMDYIDNWSLALDTTILLRTIPRVLSGKGAY